LGQSEVVFDDMLHMTAGRADVAIVIPQGAMARRHIQRGQKMSQEGVDRGRLAHSFENWQRDCRYHIGTSRINQECNCID
jgi:hypothetical protein